MSRLSLTNVLACDRGGARPRLSARAVAQRGAAQRAANGRHGLVRRELSPESRGHAPGTPLCLCVSAARARNAACLSLSGLTLASQAGLSALRLAFRLSGWPVGREPAPAHTVRLSWKERRNITACPLVSRADFVVREGAGLGSRSVFL